MRTSRCGLPLTASTSQHSTPISIIERPMVLRMSTRSRSLSGAQPQAIDIFLQAKQQAEGEYFRAAADGGDVRFDAGGRFLLPQLLGDQSERNPGEK